MTASGAKEVISNQFLVVRETNCSKPVRSDPSSFSLAKLPQNQLLQRLDADFFEKDDVVVAVILQANPAFIRTAAALRLEIEFAFWNGLALGVVSNFDSVEFDDGVRAIEGDDHGVPFGAGLAGFGERLGQRVERAGEV